MVLQSKNNGGDVTKKNIGINKKIGVVGPLSIDEGRIIRSYIGVEKADGKMGLKLGRGHR